VIAGGFKMGRGIDWAAFQEKFHPGKEYGYDNIQLGFVQGLRVVAN
jgi:hypothetical protein